jgi:hypothetical protein
MIGFCFLLNANKMSKLLEFLQSSSGELSSKRLGYLSTIPFTLLGTIWICDKLIKNSHPELAVEVWNSFFIFSAILGGFVSLEILQNLITDWKGKGK